MTKLWGWLIERERTKQIAEWRKSVDLAETMLIRFERRAEPRLRAGQAMAVFGAFVHAMRALPGRPLDLEEADRIAGEAMERLRALHGEGGQR